MMTVVGDKQLLATETLLLADDEIGTFIVSIRESDGTPSGILAFPLKVSVKFTTPDAPEASARWEYDRGTLKMTFSGWSDREGSSFRRAKRLGEHKGVP